MDELRLKFTAAESINIGKMTILEWNTNDILVEMQMWNEKKSILKSLLWTKFTHYDLINQKRIKHNNFLNEKFSKYENPLMKRVSFEQKVMDIKRKNKAK